MEKNFTLIDFENVQPKDLDILEKYPCQTFVFVGASQNKISFEIAQAMQRLGNAAEYIKICGNGPNAADFHIAYYIGELVSAYPKAHFHIISKDTGFDPLIAHLKAKKVRVHRSECLLNTLFVKNAKLSEKIIRTASDDKVMAIVKKLLGQGNKPKKEQGLSNTINSIFTNKLEEKELKSLVQKMQSNGYIKIKKGEVTYKLS